MHFFVVGRVFEQPSVAWLQEIVKLGHAVGNHTYDHVNITAIRIPQVQFRFERAPWLAHGKTPAQLIEENIRMCTAAMQERLGIQPNGFRTPGGFPDGLKRRPDSAASTRAMHSGRTPAPRSPANSTPSSPVRTPRSPSPTPPACWSCP
jgi:peptidoglycan/xylan/chitin deacetylase (PgdA/CDA1 family)